MIEYTQNNSQFHYVYFQIENQRIHDLKYNLDCLL